MPRRVLVVTYFFPPVGGVGVQRTLKHVIYLPDFGWQAIVLAPRDPAYQLRDPSLLGSIPADLEVHRTLSLEPTRLTRAVRGALGPRPSGSTPQPGSATRAAAGRRGIAARMLRAIALGWSRVWEAVLFPDEAIAWLPSALPAAWRIARRRSVDAIYSSSPPISAHVIGGLAKRLTGRPWVADFRDPWIDNPFAHQVSGWRRGWQARVERWIVGHADAVVVAVETLRDDLRRRYPELATRFVHIPNGYDPTELADLPAVAAIDPGQFRLVYAGSLYREHELERFLSGLEVLLDRRPDLERRLVVEFVGRVNEANSAVADRYAGRLGRVVRYRGFVPRREALAWMASADALLQLMPAESGAGLFVGGKLLEYLAFDRPILAIMPDGEGRQLVLGLPGGRAADLDPESIALALEELVDHPPQPTPNDPAGRYDRRNLAGLLAGVLDDVADARGSAGER